MAKSITKGGGFQVQRYAKSPPQAGSIESPQFRKKKKKKTTLADQPDTVPGALAEKIKKKKKSDIETKPKSKIGTALVVADLPEHRQKKLLKNVAKLDEAVTQMQSTFGMREQSIMDLLEQGDSENSIIMFQKQAYATVLKLIPIAEAEYIKSKRDHQAYVLNALISQGRELAADLQASGDRAQLADIIIDEILEPTFKSILQFMMQESMQLKALLSDKIEPKFRANAIYEMDQSLKSVAASMTSLYKMTSDGIRKRLLGD